MRRSLALLAVPVAVALHGCGDTCSTKPAGVQALNPAGCSVASGSVTFTTTGSCQQCTDTSPSCSAELVNGYVQLDTIYHQCSANAGCSGTSCAFPNPTFSCALTLAPGTYTVMAPTDAGTTTTSLTVSSASGGGTCTL